MIELEYRKPDLIVIVDGIECKLAEDFCGQLEFEDVDFLNEIHGVEFITESLLDQAKEWARGRGLRVEGDE